MKIDLRNERLHVKLTAAERLRLQELARVNGLSVSDLVRTRLLYPPGRPQMNSGTK